MLKVIPIVIAGLFAIVRPACSQTAEHETLGGADRHETAEQDRGYLFGDWGGLRTRLDERGVDFDVQYISDSLWGSTSGPPSQFEIWNRVRATVDIDLGTLLRWDGMYFHATGLWQGGGNLGERLGLISSRSGMSSEQTFRLDSWWLEKRWRNDQIVVRAGNLRARTSTEPNMMLRPLSSSRWDTHWTTCLILSNRSIPRPPLRPRFEFRRCATYT